MNNVRPTASRRMPTPKQMEKLASFVGINVPGVSIGPADDLPAEILEGHPIGRSCRRQTARPDMLMQLLADVPRHVLRVSCTADRERRSGKAPDWRSLISRARRKTRCNGGIVATAAVASHRYSSDTEPRNGADR
jgi:hypothetical protein